MTAGHCASSSRGTTAAFPQALAEFDLLVTSNGTQFDLPVLRADFPVDPVPGPCGPALSHGPPGYKGGRRRSSPASASIAPGVDGMDGYAAVLLWQRYQRGDKSALDLLLS